MTTVTPPAPEQENSHYGGCEGADGRSGEDSVNL